MSSVFYVFLVFFLLVGNTEAFYSINYAATSDIRSNLVNTGASFLEAPSAEHVADIYARLSGHAPLYRTENEKLPTIDALAEIKDKPVILEVHGGSKYIYMKWPYFWIRILFIVDFYEILKKHLSSNYLHLLNAKQSSNPHLI